MKKRKGFSLALVLIIMLVVIFLSAVIMDLTTNYFNTSQATIEHQKLYNAAQSGLEEGKAWLLQNKDSIDSTKISPVNSIDDITLHSADIAMDGSISVEMKVFSCNYDPSGVSPSSMDLPPVYEAYYPSGSGNIDSGVGTSTYIDPNRDLLGLAGGGHPVFVVRSRAELEGKSTEIETMVVIANE